MKSKLNFFLIILAGELVITLIVGFIFVAIQRGRRAAPPEPTVPTYVKAEYELYEDRELDEAQATCRIGYWELYSRSGFVSTKEDEYMQSCMLLHGYKQQ